MKINRHEGGPASRLLRAGAIHSGLERGVIRAEAVEELGLNVTRAAEIPGVRRATLSALPNGNAALSPEMALRIEKAFDVSMDMLPWMQAWWDASQMRARAREINVQRYEPA